MQDIIASAEFILELTRGQGEDELTSDRALRDAVLYNFVIIGEAARAVPNGIEAGHPEVPWNDMRDMRNWVAHGYHGVDAQVVWQTIRNDLPDLVGNLHRILETDASESPPSSG